MKPAILAAGAVSIVGIVAGADGGPSKKAGWTPHWPERTRFISMAIGSPALWSTTVEGRKETSKDTLIEALEFAAAISYAGGCRSGHGTLEEIGWVASARVERHLPDTNRVAIRERIPVAVWQKKGLTMVDAEGVVIDRRDSSASKT